MVISQFDLHWGPPGIAPSDAHWPAIERFPWHSTARTPRKEPFPRPSVLHHGASETASRSPTRHTQDGDIHSSSLISSRHLSHSELPLGSRFLLHAKCGHSRRESNRGALLIQKIEGHCILYWQVGRFEIRHGILDNNIQRHEMHPNPTDTILQIDIDVCSDRLCRLS